MPLAIYSSVAGGRMEEAYREVGIIVVFSFVVVVAMNYFTHRWRKKVSL